MPANWTVGPGVRFAKPSSCVQSIRAPRSRGIMSVAPASGFYLFSRFISKIPSRRLAPRRVHYTCIHATALCRINAGIFSFACFGGNPRLRRCIMHRRRAFRFNEIRLTRRNVTNRSVRPRPARPTNFTRLLQDIFSCAIICLLIFSTDNCGFSCKFIFIYIHHVLQIHLVKNQFYVLNIPENIVL